MRLSAGRKKSSGRTLIRVGKPTSGLFPAQSFFPFDNASERIYLGSRVTLTLSMEFLEGQLQLREWAQSSAATPGALEVLSQDEQERGLRLWQP
jgi:hypothetical protein